MKFILLLFLLVSCGPYYGDKKCVKGRTFQYDSGVWVATKITCLEEK